MDAKNGVKLELIFHPLAGLDSYPIRKDFIVALVSAAKRLGLPVVPKQRTDHDLFPEAQSGEAGTAQTELHDDLLPEMSDLLPRNTGRVGGS